MFNISKTLTVINPLKINSINQYDCGNNKYLLTIKLENITYKINFVDLLLKNSLILKKEKEKLYEEEKEFLDFQFPIILTNIYIDDERALIDDILFLNFIKFEQKRNLEAKFTVNMNNLKFNLLNDKFPVIINPKEIYNLVISIEKRYANYLLLDTNTIGKKKSKEDENIKIYNFFKVFFTVRKTHKEKIKFEFRFNNSYEDFTLEKDKSNNHINNNLPDIFPERKSILVELNENEFEKNIEIRYMPIRKEYIEFPPFEIYDNFFDKIYLVFFTNKIYVNE